MNELVKTPENKSLLKPSPKSPSRSCRKKSAAENKYVEGVIKLLIKQDLHAIMIIVQTMVSSYNFNGFLNLL